MRKVLVNENTLALAQKEMFLSYKRTYLLLQHALLTFFNEAKGEKKEEIKNKIKELGEIYVHTTQSINTPRKEGN